jgi:hypothetical protein
MRSRRAEREVDMGGTVAPLPAMRKDRRASGVRARHDGSPMRTTSIKIDDHRKGGLHHQPGMRRRSWATVASTPPDPPRELPAPAALQPSAAREISLHDPPDHLRIYIIILMAEY